MSPRIKICKESECHDQATTKGFCRFHYLKNWAQVRKRRKRAVQDLNRYVEQVARKHPEDFINEISKDVNRWQDGGTEGGSFDSNADTFFDEFSNEENLDNLIDNLKVDDDY